MSLNINNISIVHWFPKPEKHKCGYCKSDNGSISYGMWADTMTVRDYQSLIDRGWRRSGRYCYKPIMNETCCPQYTIRCEALNFKMSKSHKKIIKKFNRFLNDGTLNKEIQTNDGDIDGQDPVFLLKERPRINFDYKNLNDKLSETTADIISNSDILPSCSALSSNNSNVENVSQRLTERVIKKPKVVIDKNQSSSLNLSMQETERTAPSPVKKGLGADPNKPPCKKAKLLRLERKQEKMFEKGLDFVKKNLKNEGKSLKEFLYDIPENCKSKLKIKLVSMDSEDDIFSDFDIEHDVYKKYQTIIHNDPPEKCTKEVFSRFLVRTPLKTEMWDNHSEFGYGSFHQQYWIDDNLIAVGVIDILPKCVSSVYFFYDPDYRNLTLGTYGTLREIDFTRKLHEIQPSIGYYYMGFYIHSCAKMRYKGKLIPSDLLCPETYKWYPITGCIPKLEMNKYSRLNHDPNDGDENNCSAGDIDRIKIFIFDGYIYFKSYKHRNAERRVYQNIGKLIGRNCIETLLFVSRKD